MGAVAGAGQGSLVSKVFPNPFADVVNLNFDAPLEITSTAEILDVNGRVLRTQLLPAGTETTRFNDLALPSGTYLLRVVNIDGKIELVQVLGKATK